MNDAEGQTERARETDRKREERGGGEVGATLHIHVALQRVGL